MTPESLNDLTNDTLQRSSLSSALGAKAGIVTACICGEQTSFTTFGQGITPQTPMEVGSLTKVFTGLLLADCILRGELQADTQVDTLLFGAAPHETAIRAIDLATHTSGLPRLSISPLRGLFGDPYRNIKRAHVRSWWQKHKPQRPQQPASAYSNFGFAVLGLMLEAATGKTYAELLTERILQPCGLTSTHLQLTGSPTLVQRGYGRRGNRPKPWHHAAYAPGGGLVSTAEDMTKFLQSLLSPVSPLRPALELATAPHADVPNGTIGFAWMRPHAQSWTWHNGATFGYSSMMALSLNSKCGVIVLSNGYIPQPLTQFGQTLMRGLLQTCDDKFHDAG